MPELVRRILSSSYMPHGHCYFWEPPLVFFEVLTNALIGLAYIAIAVTFGRLVWRVGGLPFRWVYILNGLFLVTCGMTHLMDIWVIWQPFYWLDVGVRGLCAIGSIGTAALMVPLVPKAASVAQAARMMRERGVRLEELNVELTMLYEKTRESLAEAIPQLVWTTTADGSVDYINQRWLEYVGVRPPGADWQACIEPLDRPAVRDLWKTSLATGESFEIECRIRGKDGAFRWFLVRALSLRSDDKIVKWFGTCTDIHDHKLVAEERERLLVRARQDLQGRDAFLAIAAHELRTPLMPLRLEIEGLERAATSEKLTPDRATARLSVAKRQVDRLERLIINLLDLSRITSGRLELSREELDLADLANEVARRHAHEMEAAGCRLTVRVDGPIVGSWDRLRIDAVITNLLMNAVTYGRGKPIALEIVTTKTSALLSVCDEGPGIALADQERIFERFERATAARHAGGLGIGLWLVREIVGAHGGSVRVESQPGHGARFTVDLPR